QSQPRGDAGGNSVYVEVAGAPPQPAGRPLNLHALWDDTPGRDTSAAYIDKYEADAVAAHPVPDHSEKKPERWISEGFDISIKDVYTFGLVTGSREQPVRLMREYE